MAISSSIIVPFGIFILSQTSWPVSYTLSVRKMMTDQVSVFIAGVICLTLATVGPFLLFRKYFTRVDPLMYVFSVFCWTCMIDLGIALELDNFISNFIGYYFAEGEPYLQTSHGTSINYWDGTSHFFMYLAMMALYSQRKSHREVGLYWAGSILNSMVVLLPGAVSGKHPFKLSILLNTPYILLPIFAGMKFLHSRPPQAKTSFKTLPIWRRPVDMLFLVYFTAASFLAIFRGISVLGGNAGLMKNYLTSYEPYMADPSSFPMFQILAYQYFFLTYYLSAIYGLLCPGQHWMADWALIHAGAAAQAQFTYIHGSIHHRTLPSFQSAGLVFWVTNLALLIVPQVFAWWCFRDEKRFGRTYTLPQELAELTENNSSHSKINGTKRD